MPDDFSGSLEAIRSWVSSLTDRSMDCMIARPVVADVSENEFIAGMRCAWSVAHRVLCPAGTTWLVLRDRRGGSGSFAGLPWRSAFALQRDGWLLRNAMVAVADDDAGVETAFLLTKESRYYFDARVGRIPPATNVGDVLFSTGDAVMMRCIAAGCSTDGIVLNLFGDVGLAGCARRLGREVVGPAFDRSRWTA